jgi:hypothetical protein
MAASRHRTAFVFGVFVGATAGIAVAFLNAPQSGRRTRDQIQQAAVRVIFKALDMVPWQNEPADTVVANHPAAAANEPPPVDIVIGSRPSEMGINQTP